MRKVLLLISVLIALFGAAATAPGDALAASRRAPPTVIENFTVDPANQITPGTEIALTIEGSPRGKASVRIAGVPRTIRLEEVERGFYEGSYTVRSNDRISPTALVRATLTARGRSDFAALNLRALPPVAAAPAAPAPAPAPKAAPNIDRFEVAPVDKLDPGVDLRFTLVGTPGGQAWVGIAGVNRDIPMKEVKSGHYEGAYTVRRLDHFPPSGDIVGRLELGGQIARARLTQPLVADAKPPVLANLSPGLNETVPPGPLTISGTFDDSGGVGVDPKSVRILVDGRDVTQNAAITSQYFTYAGKAAPGAHQVQIVAQDLRGNAMRHSWSFTVAKPAAGGVPIEITSHRNNAAIPRGATQVRGRTAPNAQVDVKVTQTAQVVGLFGVNQEVLNQTVRADAKGNFTFRFQPQINVPGARYEISLKARTDQATSRDVRVVLFQQK